MALSYEPDERARGVVNANIGRDSLYNLPPDLGKPDSSAQHSSIDGIQVAGINILGFKVPETQNIPNKIEKALGEKAPEANKTLQDLFKEDGGGATLATSVAMRLGIESKRQETATGNDNNDDVYKTLDATLGSPEMRAALSAIAKDKLLTNRFSIVIVDQKVDIQNPEDIMDAIFTRVLSNETNTAATPDYDMLGTFIRNYDLTPNDNTTTGTGNIATLIDRIHPSTRAELMDELKQKALEASQGEANQKIGTNSSVDPNAIFSQIVAVNNSLSPEEINLLSALSQNEHTRVLAHEIINKPAFLGTHNANQDIQAALNDTLHNSDNLTPETRSALSGILHSSDAAKVIGEQLQNYTHLHKLYTGLSISAQQSLGYLVGASLGLGDGGGSSASGSTKLLEDVDAFIDNNTWMQNLATNEPALIEQLLDSPNLIDPEQGITAQSVYDSLRNHVLSGQAERENWESEAAARQTQLDGPQFAQWLKENPEPVIADDGDINLDIAHRTLVAIDPRVNITLSLMPESMQHVLLKEAIGQMNPEIANPATTASAANISTLDFDNQVEALAALRGESMFRSFSAYLNRSSPNNDGLTNGDDLAQYLEANPDQLPAFIGNDDKARREVIDNWMEQTNRGLMAQIEIGLANLLGPEIVEALKMIFTGDFQNGFDKLLEGLDNMFKEHTGVDFDDIRSFMNGDGEITIGTTQGVEQMQKLTSGIGAEILNSLGHDPKEIQQVLEANKQAQIIFKLNGEKLDIYIDQDGEGTKHDRELLTQEEWKKIYEDATTQTRQPASPLAPNS